MKTEEEKYIYLPLLTVPEAAKYMGVGRKIIYQLIEFDQVRAVRNKGAVLLEKKSLDDFRSSGRLT
jgi:excisionase family DNA binding protein